jgi:hypothetical protein
MKYYHSDFAPSDTEYLYQQIEELKKYLSAEALFLMEEEKTLIKGQVRIVLKVKENEVLFLVDSTAPDLLRAAYAAKEAMIRLVTKRRNNPEQKVAAPQVRIIYN